MKSADYATRLVGLDEDGLMGQAERYLGFLYGAPPNRSYERKVELIRAEYVRRGQLDQFQQIQQRKLVGR